MGSTRRSNALAEMKKLLATQIKLDITTTIRHHPHLAGDDAVRAYESLANDATVDELVEDVAREAVQEAVDRGEVPAAAWLHLAGFKMNRLPEG